MMIRSQAVDFGFELNEFDPFFNFRATEFLVNNGFDAYYSWHDYMSWHPEGRDISGTSQSMLHITAATTYKIFGGSIPLYDYTILFPVVIGSLTAVSVFALIRVIGGTTAGLFGAMFYAVSVPIAVRGTIGWFKSEPLGLFYGVIGLYLFLSGIKSENAKIALPKIVGAGMILAFSLASWGGTQFFIIPLGMFIIALPFFRTDKKFLVWSIPLFVGSLLLTSSLFDRPGVGFVTGIGGISLIVSTAFLVISCVLQKFSRDEVRLRNNGIFLAIFIIVSILAVITIIDSEDLPSFRYQNALNPFLTTNDPLVDSVSEHATTTIKTSFMFHSVLMIFAGFAIWYIIKNKKEAIDPRFNLKNDMMIFSLIMGMAGVYAASTFIRLELFASVSIIILASLGLSILVKEFIINRGIRTPRRLTKIIFLGLIGVFLLIPITFPANANWVATVKAPPTILNGGSSYAIATSDWPDALDWLKENTPEDAVVAAWWDYGYWITTLGERTTLADNATLSTEKIQKIAQMFLSSPDKAYRILTEELDADYVVVYVAGQKVTGTDAKEPLYILNGGGDESKKQWFMKISGKNPSKYLHPDGISGTDLFWNETILGKMFPFTPLAFINPNTNEQSLNFKPGFIQIYSKDVKYPEGGDGPLELVYSSASVDRANVGPINSVFIYKVNPDYKSATSTADQ